MSSAEEHALTRSSTVRTKGELVLLGLVQNNFFFPVTEFETFHLSFFFDVLVDVKLTPYSNRHGKVHFPIILNFVIFNQMAKNPLDSNY
jgi:hypothetical protein